MRWALALLAAGCVGSTGNTPRTDGAVDDLAASAGDFSTGPADLSSASAYPSGPYGNAAGDTFPLLAWEGYVDDHADAIATSKPYGPYGSDALRRSGRPYALIHVSEFY